MAEEVKEVVTEANEPVAEVAEVVYGPSEGTQIITLKKLLEAGSQFGHQTKRWNPKMSKYIYGPRNGIYIIDLVKTVAGVEAAYNKLKEISANGGKTLFVGTKKQVKDVVAEEAVRSGSFYVNQRWLGGTLTNFKTISRRTRRLLQIETMIEDGTLETYPKKDQLAIKKEQERLLKFFEGIKEMRKLPQALFVVDPHTEHNAVLEAKKLNIPVFAIVDTNADPDDVDFVIPANDDATRSVKLITSTIADAICEAKGEALANAYSKEEGEDVSMSDVIKASDKQAEARRQAKLAREREERAAAQARFNRRNNKPRTPREPKKVEAAPAAETKSEEVKAD